LLCINIGAFWTRRQSGSGAAYIKKGGGAGSGEAGRRAALSTSERAGQGRRRRFYQWEGLLRAGKRVEG